MSEPLAGKTKAQADASGRPVPSLARRNGPHELAGARPTVENDESAPDLVSSSPSYARRFAGRAGAYLLARQDEGIRRAVQSLGQAPLDVLDVGGGHAQVAPVLAQLGHRVVVHGSVAASLEQIPELQRRYPNAIDTRVGPIWTLPARDGEFDLVVAIRMLGHVSRWEALLAELCRVTRRCVLVEFAAASGAQRLSQRMFGIKRHLEGDTRRFATYEVRRVEAELERLGFRVRVVDRQFALPIVLHRILREPRVSRVLEGICAAIGLTRRLGSPVLLLAERLPTGGTR